MSVLHEFLHFGKFEGAELISSNHNPENFRLMRNLLVRVGNIAGEGVIN